MASGTGNKKAMKEKQKFPVDLWSDEWISDEFMNNLI